MNAVLPEFVAEQFLNMLFVHPDVDVYVPDAK